MVCKTSHVEEARFSEPRARPLFLSLLPTEAGPGALADREKVRIACDSIKDGFPMKTGLVLKHRA